MLCLSRERAFVAPPKARIVTPPLTLVSPKWACITSAVRYTAALPSPMPGRRSRSLGVQSVFKISGARSLVAFVASDITATPRTRLWISRTLALNVIAAIGTLPAAAQLCGTLQDLGTLGGGTYSDVRAISGDGSVVVGESPNSMGQLRAFRWTVGDGMDEFLNPLAGAPHVILNGLSFDGSVMMGQAQTGPGETRVFRWVANGGAMDIGTLGGASTQNSVMLDDGSVIVGESYTSANLLCAFRWSLAGSMQSPIYCGGTSARANAISSDGLTVVGYQHNGSTGYLIAWRWRDGTANLLLPLPGATGGAVATGVSGDGSVVVGHAVYSLTNSRAFRWTIEGGMQDLGTLGGSWSRPIFVSPDGSVVIGNSTNAAGQERAFRWTAETEMTEIPNPFGGPYSRAWSASSDASVVVGEARHAAGYPVAFRWTATHGMQDLGFLPDGIGAYATHVSADGSVVVGRASHSAGFQRVFRWIACCPSDYTGDTLVDILDFLDFIDDFSTCDQLPAPCGTFGNPDLNGDTTIDILDFLDFLDAFSNGC
jgi:probable HAF family extracellular repeat protein